MRNWEQCRLSRVQHEKSGLLLMRSGSFPWTVGIIVPKNAHVLWTSVQMLYFIYLHVLCIFSMLADSNCSTKHLMAKSHRRLVAMVHWEHAFCLVIFGCELDTDAKR